MIAKLNKILAPEVADAPLSRDELQLATCALLVETACHDGDFDAKERETIETICNKRFGLTREDSEELIADAEAVQATSSGLLPFTRVVKQRCSEEQRREVIEMLWQVAYADGELHDFEANLLRRVGGLIYVSDRAIGIARKRVLARLGLEG